MHIFYYTINKKFNTIYPSLFTSVLTFLTLLSNSEEYFMASNILTKKLSKLCLRN